MGYCQLRSDKALAAINKVQNPCCGGKFTVTNPERVNLFLKEYKQMTADGKVITKDAIMESIKENNPYITFMKDVYIFDTGSSVSSNDTLKSGRPFKYGNDNDYDGDTIYSNEKYPSLPEEDYSKKND